VKTRNAIALAILAAGSTAAIVQGLHAQSKPPIYYVAELEMLNADAMKEWGSLVEASIKKAGGRYVVRGTNITALEGAPPKQLVITVWDSMDKLKAWYDGPYKDMRPMRDKAHRSVRAYAVEGVPN
jgi:uncharacterized protein (DUF1330 family)